MSNSENYNPIPNHHALQAIPAGMSQLPMPANGSQGQGSGAFTQITPAFLWWVFQEWWKLIVPAGMLAAGVASFFVVSSHVPQYEASAMLIIEDASPYIAFAGSNKDSKRYVATQQQIIRSNIVLEPVLALPRIAAIPELVNSPDRAETLRKNLWVKAQGGSEIYNICYTSTSPADAAAVVNAVADQYMVYHQEDEVQRTNHVVSLLEEERQRRSLQVERLRRRLVDMAEEAKGADPFSGSIKDAKRASSPIGDIVQSLTDMDLQR
jgi:uncharacterized protein involved in exopolysaccharide biosynthesis